MATPIILKEKRILRLKSLLLDCYQKGYIFDFELDRVHKYLQQIRDYGFSYSPNTLKRFEIFEVVKTSRGQKKLHTKKITHKKNTVTIEQATWTRIYYEHKRY